MNRTWVVVGLAIFFLAPTSARADHIAPASRPDVNLLCWGDWGVDERPRQQVADSIANFVRNFPHKMDAAILLGDNFRLPVADINDPVIQTIFEKSYDAKVLDFPFYVALGNHDYEDNKHAIELEYARRNPSSRWKLPDDWYRVDLPAGSSDPLVTLIVLASDRDEISPDDWDSQTEWLGRQLSGKRARWTVCAAHHTMFSNGVHGDNAILQKDWGALFKQFHVDFYLCGHDHDMEHHEIPGWPTSFVVSGGGGAAARPIRRNDRGPFFKSENGFVHLQFNQASAAVQIMNAQGHLEHSFERNADGQVTTTFTSGNDPKTARPLRAIQGLDEKPSTRPATNP